MARTASPALAYEAKLASYSESESDIEGVYSLAQPSIRHYFARSIKPISLCLCVVFSSLGFLYLFNAVLSDGTIPSNPHNGSTQNTSFDDSALSEIGPIPTQIWQMYIRPLGHERPEPELFNDSRTWLAMNPDFEYTLVGRDALNSFVEAEYAHRPDIVQTYQQLQVPILKADYGRYLLLAATGGVYADLDVACKRPIVEWIPEEWQTETSVVLGLEYDQRDGDPWGRMPVPLMFSQYAMAAAPHHPLLERALEDVTRNLQDLAKRQNTTLGGLRPTHDDVGATTGPIAWTISILEALRELTGQPFDWHAFSMLRGPVKVADVVVHPINAFGSGQPHSGSQWPSEVEDQVLAYHAFRASWASQTSGVANGPPHWQSLEATSQDPAEVIDDINING